MNNAGNGPNDVYAGMTIREAEEYDRQRGQPEPPPHILLPGKLHCARCGAPSLVLANTPCRL